MVNVNNHASKLLGKIIDNLLSKMFGRECCQLPMKILGI